MPTFGMWSRGMQKRESCAKGMCVAIAILVQRWRVLRRFACWSASVRISGGRLAVARAHTIFPLLGGWWVGAWGVAEAMQQGVAVLRSILSGIGTCELSGRWVAHRGLLRLDPGAVPRTQALHAQFFIGRNDAHGQRTEPPACGEGRTSAAHHTGGQRGGQGVRADAKKTRTPQEAARAEGAPPTARAR